MTRKGNARRKRSRSAGRRPTGLVDRRREGEDLAAGLVAKDAIDFPFYVPSKLTAQGRYTTVQPSPRAYQLRDRAEREHDAYRIVVVQNELEGQYYGIQGTTWRTPPFLAKPTGTREVRGRELLTVPLGRSPALRGVAHAPCACTGCRTR